MSFLSTSRELTRSEKFLFAFNLAVCFFTGFYYLLNQSDLVICLIISGTCGFVFGLFYGKTSKSYFVIYPFAFLLGNTSFMISTMLYFKIRGFAVDVHPFEIAVPFFIAVCVIGGFEFLMIELIKKFRSVTKCRRAIDRHN